MTIPEFMTDRIVVIQNIITDLKDTFNSHEFIEKFSKQFEPFYIDFLQQYRGNGAFLTVHGQIAKFLSDNSTTLRIRKTRKVPSRNIFGETDNIQEWKKS
jgi:hypothetical protein